MNEQTDLFVDIVIIMAVAFGGGLVARALRLPVLLGYLAVGIIIGPNGAEVIQDIDNVNILAEFGVILLLFAVGVEVSFGDLRKLRNVAVGGGALQIAATFALGYLIGRGFGWDGGQSLVFGLIVSLSSTMVVLKLLSDRGELRSLHGRVLTGMLIVQDLAFIPMIAILPAIGGDDGFSMLELGLGVLKAVVLLAITVTLGARLVPMVLERVARFGSREIFLLTIIAITFSAAAATREVGLSAALGAFVAGLVLSESDFGHRALSEIVPLRDVFSALFFVSLGMLADPSVITDDTGTVVAVVAGVIGIKFLVTATLVRGFGYLPHTALVTGLGMGQIGEFSFILATAALSREIVDDNFMAVIVLSAVLTMGLTPLTLAGGTRLIDRLTRRFRFLRPHRPGDSERSEERGPRLRDHVVIAGMGRIGSLVGQSLQEHNVPFIAIDLDPYIAAQSRDRGQYGIHGSSANDIVLNAARIRFAKLLVVATGDPASAYVTVENALRINPKLDIVARVHWREEGERLKALGVTEVVWPEMEAGLEILRHTLNARHTKPKEVDSLVARLREHLSFGPTAPVEALPTDGIGEPPVVDDPPRRTS